MYMCVVSPFQGHPCLCGKVWGCMIFSLCFLVKGIFLSQTSFLFFHFLFPLFLSVLQEVFSAVRDRYMRDGEGFLLVYSLTERTTFLPISKIYQQIQRVKDTEKAVAVVLVGNKVTMHSCRA